MKRKKKTFFWGGRPSKSDFKRGVTAEKTGFLKCFRVVFEFFFVCLFFGVGWLLFLCFFWTPRNGGF